MTVAAVSDEPVIGSVHRDERPVQRAWALLGVVVTALVVGGLVATTRRDGGGGLTADDVVRASLIIAWAAAGVTLARQSSALGRIVLAGATVAGVAYLAGAMAAMKDGDNLAVVAVHVIAVGLLPAVGLHFVLSLADGVLGSAAGWPPLPSVMPARRSPGCSPSPPTGRCRAG